MVFVVWMSIGVSDYQLWSEKGKITNHWQCIRRIGRNDASEWKFSCQIWSNRRVTVLQNRSSFNPNKERNASQSIMHRSFYCIYGCVAIGQLDSAVWHLGNIMLGNNGFYHSGERYFFMYHLPWHHWRLTSFLQWQCYLSEGQCTLPHCISWMKMDLGTWRLYSICFILKRSYLLSTQSWITFKVGITVSSQQVVKPKKKQKTLWPLSSPSPPPPISHYYCIFQIINPIKSQPST